MGVGDQLDLDVARLFDELLDEHPIVAEGRLRLVPRRLEPGTDVVEGVGHAHALAAAAGGRLEHDGTTDLDRDAVRLVGVGDRVGVTGNGADARLGGDLLRLDLVAHRLDRPHPGAYEDDAGLLERGRERGVLGEKAEARMHRVRPRLLDGREDRLDVQVALARGVPRRCAPPRPPGARAARGGRRRSARRPSRCRDDGRSR